MQILGCALHWKMYKRAEQMINNVWVYLTAKHLFQLQPKPVASTCLHALMTFNKSCAAFIIAIMKKTVNNYSIESIGDADYNYY